MTGFPSILPQGDSALILEFGNTISENVNRRVLSVFRMLKAKNIPWVIDIVPAYASLTVHYDVLKLFGEGSDDPFQDAKDHIEGLLTEVPVEVAAEIAKTIRVPVCYSLDFGPDLEVISRQKKISVEDIIRLHAAKTYRVYMIGFLPGFAYMGEVDEKIAIARKEQPRRSVHAGSVGIAGKQTGIYPLDSPGGWQLIGRTPLILFKKHDTDPVLLKPGDLIQFYPITENEFDHYQGGIT